ncbi:unnamed protein product [Thlaspi arvense]|uniref:Carboxylesterase n=1 Tax=Thlaspi arvense TaxID=13288 RepID=A0AAU9RK89_THLAR|nr:unnamed protein product [Thlaspi arvense]
MARSKRKSQTSPPGGLPLKLKFLIAAHTFAFNASRRLDGSLNRCLMNLFDPKSPANCKPIKGVASSDVTVDASFNIWFRLYTPSPSPNPKDPALPFILFFHGGGFALSLPIQKSMMTSAAVSPSTSLPLSPPSTTREWQHSAPPGGESWGTRVQEGEDQMAGGVVAFLRRGRTNGVRTPVGERSSIVEVEGYRLVLEGVFAKGSRL